MRVAGAWLPLTLYLLFNILSSVFVVLVIKARAVQQRGLFTVLVQHGSASLMYLISTLRLPLVQLAFCVS